MWPRNPSESESHLRRRGTQARHAAPLRCLTLGCPSGSRSALISGPADDRRRWGSGARRGKIVTDGTMSDLATTLPERYEALWEGPEPGGSTLGDRAPWFHELLAQPVPKSTRVVIDSVSRRGASDACDMLFERLVYLDVVPASLL